MDLIGTFLMEAESNVWALHTTELGSFLMLVVEQYVSTVTLGLPQQESSTVTYLMPVETFRASMWGYILLPQVSLVQFVLFCGTFEAIELGMNQEVFSNVLVHKNNNSRDVT